MNKSTPVNVINKVKIDNLISKLENNNMNGYYADSTSNLLDTVKSIMSENDCVSVGGSMTLFETGLIDFLRNNNYNFLDRYEEGISKTDIENIYFRTFASDVYICSTNAITSNGELYNVDGNGNRVAAMIYGPKKVIVVAGVNKIVASVEDAIKRNEEFAAPMNCERLDRKTPCRKTGRCMNCSSPERICNSYTLIKKQFNKDRIHVILMNENLGY